MTGTPLLDDFERWIEINHPDSELYAHYIERIYLADYTGSLPPDWPLSDDTVRDIREKFAMLLTFIIDRLHDKEITKRRATLVIDASYDDETYYVILTETKVLYFNHMEAWHLKKMTRGELDYFLREIWDTTVKALGGYDDGRPMYGRKEA